MLPLAKQFTIKGEEGEYTFAVAGYSLDEFAQSIADNNESAVLIAFAPSSKGADEATSDATGEVDAKHFTWVLAKPYVGYSIGVNSLANSYLLTATADDGLMYVIEPDLRGSNNGVFLATLFGRSRGGLGYHDSIEEAQAKAEAYDLDRVARVPSR